MARTNLYVLPGLMGSELAQTSAVYQRPEQGWVRDPTYASGDQRAPVWRKVQWIDRTNFLSDENVSALRISATAVNAPVLPTRPIPGFYDALLNRLRRDVPPDWSVIPWAWDWRGDLWLQGAQLALFIRAQGPCEGGHRLLGHSCGGLVARACYADLARTSEQSLIPRIVTLGTPHYGTYSPALAWAERDDLTDVVGLLGVGAQFLRQGRIGQVRALADAAITFGGSVTAAQERYTRKALELLTNWQACYDLLPDPDKRDDPADTNRQMVYESDTWAEAVVRPDTIYSLPRAGNDPRVGDASSLQYRLHSIPPPPANVLTCIAGTGYSTPQRIERANARAMPSSATRGSRTWRSFHLPVWSRTTGGDGYVTRTSALEPSTRQVIVEVEHSDLVTNSTVLSSLFGYLSDVAPTVQPPLTLLRVGERAPNAAPGVFDPTRAQSAPVVTTPAPTIIKPPGVPAVAAELLHRPIPIRVPFQPTRGGASRPPVRPR